jgi:membrane protein
LAAQLAYYFFLALFPSLLCVIALASLFPLENLADDVSRLLAPIATGEMIEVIQQQIVRIAQSNNAGLFGIGLLGAVWSASAAMAAVVAAMNRAYGLEEGRPWWKIRLTAILLTVGLSLFILVSFTLVVAGPEIADALASRLGLGGTFVAAWKILQWPVAFALVATGIGVIYNFAPDADQDWVWITPGSVLATLLWLGGSLGFRFYVINFGSYEATYGAIGGIILLLLWFNLTGLVIVVGAELNAEIDRASPWGAAPATAAAGQRRKIGRAAAREWRAHARVAASPPSLVERAAALIVGGLLFLRWRRRSGRRGRRATHHIS